MEVEQIYEKAWYAVTETCLAMTIFRDEFDVRFIIMFGVLLFMKCFSWIGAGRVEFVSVIGRAPEVVHDADGVSITDGATTPRATRLIPYPLGE